MISLDNKPILIQELMELFDTKYYGKSFFLQIGVLPFSFNFLCFWGVGYPPVLVICWIVLLRNNWPVQVICKQEDDAAMGILVSAVTPRP